MHEHISPLLAEHPHRVNIFLGPVTVHYREVSLYLCDRKARFQKKIPNCTSSVF